MKTLKDHLILYDAECPMCNLYTRAFTSTGMLEADGRAPYQNLKTFSCPSVDRKRAVNEIALVNTKTGEVSYGIDSLFKVIGNACPLFKPLFNLKPFTWAMRKLYAFISYNRKVIIPAPKTTEPTLQPTFSLKHRIAWLVFTTLTAAAILTHYSHLLPFPGSAGREYMICTGQLFFQGFIVSVIAPPKRWDYLGNMMTISLAGSLLLLPVIPLHPNPALATGWFAMVATAMFFEHLRRCKLLGVGRVLTITWFFYRAALLGVIVLTAAR